MYVFVGGGEEAIFIGRGRGGQRDVRAFSCKLGRETEAFWRRGGEGGDDMNMILYVTSFGTVNFSVTASIIVYSTLLVTEVRCETMVNMEDEVVYWERRSGL